MLCNECQELISDYIDGELELGEQAKVERHLGDCEPCRAVRDDLLQIVHFSNQLPEHAPSGALWARIRSDIEEQKPAGFWSRAGAWWAITKSRQFDLSIPQMAAAAAALVIVISIGVIASRQPAAPVAMSLAGSAQSATSQVRPLSGPDFQQLEKQISNLSATIEQRKVSWDPQLRVKFEKNMSLIEQSLAECRHQLSDNPGDDVSQELMLNAYREKVRLLEGFESF
ncbi:MAG: zf-HC2 domain-containing protein [Blastocatellia bacterium]